MMTRLKNTIYGPFRQGLRFLIVANMLLGLLLFQAANRANDTGAGQVTDIHTIERDNGTAMSVSGEYVWMEALNSNGAPDIFTPNTITEDGIPESVSKHTTINDMTAEAAVSSPANTELPPGYPQDIYHGNADNPSSDVDYKYQIRYVDREVIKEVPIEKSMELREFASLEELKMWLAEDDTNEHIYLFADKDGICRRSDSYDCDDYAFELQRRAVSNGFLISVTIVYLRGTPHMINLAGISNKIYYIEPQTDKVWFHCTRD